MLAPEKILPVVIGTIAGIYLWEKFLKDMLK